MSTIYSTFNFNIQNIGELFILISILHSPINYLFKNFRYLFNIQLFIQLSTLRPRLHGVGDPGFFCFVSPRA